MIGIPTGKIIGNYFFRALKGHSLKEAILE